MKPKRRSTTDPRSRSFFSDVGGAVTEPIENSHKSWRIVVSAGRQLIEHLTRTQTRPQGEYALATIFATYFIGVGSGIGR
jgi:hypothetical protein